MQPDLQISIVSYNTRELLDNCLQSIFTLPGHSSFEVTVIDNGSTDESPARVRQRFPAVRVLESGANIGYGRANNLALLGRPGRYYAILNSDLILQPGALDAMAGYLDAHPEVGAAGGALLNPDPATTALPWSQWKASVPQTNWAVGELTLASVACEQLFLSRIFPRSRLFGDYFRAYWKRDATTFVPQACGAFLVVRSELYNALGGFDPRIFMYCEDTDLCRRLRDTGLQIAYVVDAPAIHVHGQSSTGKLRPQMIYEHNRSRVYYFAKHSGLAAAQTAKTIMTAGAALRIAQRLLLAALRPSQAGRYAEEASGYFRVLLKTPFMRTAYPVLAYPVLEDSATPPEAG